ncbi:MAG: WecB/TagA/CpsF family glycosyltransferase [Lachnospiraceae bacterium]|nr:WecB/TagA/CpsF family glycosyltransferase [Lachnospiraceae bacterium]
MKFLNTQIDNVTMEEAVDEIDRMVCSGMNQYVVTPNVDHIVQMEKDPLLREIYENAALITTDGKPLIWISRWLSTPIIEKVSGSDLFPRVCERAAQKGYRIFLLGAAEGVAVRAAKNLQRKYPGLQIAGTYSPPFGFEENKEELEHIFRLVERAKPQIMALGLGCPKQEKFFYRNRDNFHVPVVLHIGGTIDFEAGNIPRAPGWVSRVGLEWLYRLTKDPKRLAKRYLVDDMAIWRIGWKYRASQNQDFDS